MAEKKQCYLREIVSAQPGPDQCPLLQVTCACRVVHQYVIEDDAMRSYMCGTEIEGNELEQLIRVIRQRNYTIHALQTARNQIYSRHAGLPQEPVRNVH